MEISKSLEKSSASFGSKVVSASQLLTSLEERKRKPPLVTNIVPLDQLYHGGLQRGTLIEFTGAASSGRLALGLAALAAATQSGESCAFIDLGDHLDPRLAEAAGVHLPRLLWLRPSDLKKALLATEMVLATGFGLVVLDLGMDIPSSRDLSDSIGARLSLTAKAQNNILFVMGPCPFCARAADARITLQGARPIWTGKEGERLLAGLSVSVQIEQRKGTRQTQSVRLSLPVLENLPR